jgi:hypothetical protein
MGDALGAEPVGYVQAAHSVVAIEDDVLVGIELLEIRGNGAHGNQFGAFDAALRVFPRFADVDEQHFVAAIEAQFYFLWCDFEIIHRLSVAGLLDSAFRGDPQFLVGLDVVEDYQVFGLWEHVVHVFGVLLFV